MRRTSLPGRIAFNLLAWTLVLLVAFPLIWMILTSVKPQTELFRIPPSFWPTEITFEHYRRLLVETPFLTYMRNSIFLALGTTLLVITLATLGAHSLVRFRYPGRERLARLVLFTYLLPSVVLIIPLYLLMVQMGIANTLWSLILAYTTFALPYALWPLRSFMAGIPDDLEAAASTVPAVWKPSSTSSSPRRSPASSRPPSSPPSSPGTSISTRWCW